MSADVQRSTWAVSIIQKIISQPSASFERIQLSVGQARALLAHKPTELSERNFGALLRKLQRNVPADVANDKQIFTSVSRSIGHLDDARAPYPFPGIDISYDHLIIAFLCNSKSQGK